MKTNKDTLVRKLKLISDVYSTTVESHIIRELNRAHTRVKAELDVILEKEAEEYVKKLLEEGKS